MATLPKAALVRAVSDEIPLEQLQSGTIGADYMPPDQIAAVAREAIAGDESEEDEEGKGGKAGDTAFAGINRYVFVGEGARAFIDPAGTLVHAARQEARELRRSRAADPVGLKTKPRTMAQKQTVKPSGM